MKQLKPIALNQITIAKPMPQDEVNCGSVASQGAEDAFRETASFNNHHRKRVSLASKSSKNSGFDSIDVPDPRLADQVANKHNEPASLSIQKQKSSPPINSSFGSPSPRNIPLAHRTFAIVDPDPADPQQFILDSIEQSQPLETSFDSSNFHKRSQSELLVREPAQAERDFQEAPRPLALRL